MSSTSLCHLANHDALVHLPGLAGPSHHYRTHWSAFNHVLSSMTLILSYPFHLLEITGHHELGLEPNEAERGQVLPSWARKAIATSMTSGGIGGHVAKKAELRPLYVGGFVVLAD